MSRYLLIAILGIGIFFRIYNLSWGAPFYFHPDERNIASSVSQLNFPQQLDPNFFAYGTFPIYVIYFTGVFFNFPNLFHSPLSITKVAFENAIIISRIYSVLFSLLLLFLIYKTGDLLNNKRLGVMSFTLSSLSVAFIQYSHFGTFEMWLTFFSYLLFFFLFLYYKKNKEYLLVITSVIFGLLLAIKVSSAIIFAIPFFVIGLAEIKKNKNKFSLFFNFTGRVFAFCLISFVVFFITNPFVFIDSNAFLNSMRYETSVALGTLPVFYTGSFYNQLPVIFHFQHVLPFLINPILALIAIPAIFYTVYRIKRRKELDIFLIFSFFCFLFFSQTFLFVKWTRYIVPSLPFLYLLISLFLIGFLKSKKNIKIFFYFLIIISLFFSSSFFITNYLNRDTRVEALNFSKKNIPGNPKILSEVYDLGIVPFNSDFSNITLFNFYDLDLTPQKTEELKNELKENKYIILPSQRIIHSRFINPKTFPKGYTFYKDLLNGSLGFKKIYETPCNLYCKISYLGDPVFSVEETAAVFDRPTIFIFERSEKRTE